MAFTPSACRLRSRRHTERPGVCVQCHALQLQVAPVQPEAGRGFEMRVANSEGNRAFIQQRAVIRHYLDARAIQNGIGDVPTVRIGQCLLRNQRSGPTCGQEQRFAANLFEIMAVGI
jgi:hypothetical protein